MSRKDNGPPMPVLDLLLRFSARLQRAGPFLFEAGETEEWLENPGVSC
jgi:hypothetical protein